ncbi:hypothetical protein DBR42_05090 [Pelomonas sp. HMWF004]|nr:hypothetical protein DBR42_05090 [Pelomonas sp. HMWF004]
MRSLLLVLVASLVATAVAQAAPVNLVVNGSFETTTVANGSWVNTGNVSGWQVVGGPGSGFEVRNGAVGTAHGGSKFIELDTNGNTVIEQRFDSLLEGGTYSLNFWYSPRIGQSAATNGLSLFWNGAALASNITATGGSANLWAEYHFNVAALSGVNSLRFASVGTSDGLGGNLDDVSLTARVPEPATAGLIAIALGALGWARRRKA